MNAQIRLNGVATNIFNKQNPTVAYLTDPTSALFTNTSTKIRA